MKILPGDLLPGASVSPLQTMSFEPMGSGDFEGIYPVPANLCRSDGHVKIRITYMFKDRLQAADLVAPLHFRFDEAK
jgi:hypothetical protein